MGLRRATPEDIDDLVRLRGVMFDAMGVDSSGEWRAECAEVLRRCLADGTMAAFVVAEGGRVVSCGVGMLAQRLPGPKTRGGRYGYVQSMATDVHARRRGHAHAVFGALLEWFEENGATSIGLHATEEGARVYRSFGFSEPRHLELARHEPR